MENKQEFIKELRDLLVKYNVEIFTADTCLPIRVDYVYSRTYQEPILEIEELSPTTLNDLLNN